MRKNGKLRKSIINGTIHTRLKWVIEKEAGEGNCQSEEKAIYTVEAINPDKSRKLPDYGF